MSRNLILFAAVMFASLNLFGAPKIVVLGFDGADPKLISQYMDEGSLPNLKKLREEGCFKELEVANPPQTPVSWGVFMTSLNPGKNEVFDFLRRDPKTYKPSFALNEEGRKTFLFGKLNGSVFASAVFLMFLLAGFLCAKIFRSPNRSMIISAFAVPGVFLSIFVLQFVSDNLPSKIPYAINHLKGKPFWEYAGENGMKAVVIRHPDTFPAQPFRKGRLLAGLGVPDIRGRIGTPYILTTDYSLKMRDNEFSVEIVPVNSMVYEEEQSVDIPGPYNKPFYSYPLSEYEDGCADEDLKDALMREGKKELDEKGVAEIAVFPVKLRVDPQKEICSVLVSGRRLELKKREWSPWIDVEFKLSRLVKIKGLVRLYLMEVKPELRLYMSPIQIHPDNNLQISYPQNYAKELFKRFGPFKTMGWAVDTWTISSSLSDEEQFLSDMYETEGAYEKMMVALLKDGDMDLYVQVYEFTDRIGHILWRYMDEGHPLYDKEKAPVYREELKKSYIYMDKIVGEAMAVIPKGTTLIVLSDHGFASFRKEVNYNKWLVDNGFMFVKENPGLMSLYDLFDDNRLLFKNVDWSKTKAYALGLGNIYVNLKGREKEGIVREGAEYESVMKDISEKLPLMRDPDNGEAPVCRVYRRDEIYRDYDPDLVPDLRVSNNPGYRVSWQTSLGGVPDSLISINAKPWSGDHCSLDPKWVKGMFFMNRKIDGMVNILDIAPTVLAILGEKVPPEMEGKALAGK
jgi:predicted AlkP superfamily phosphohydrolase/phosphomutase